MVVYIYYCIIYIYINYESLHLKLDSHIYTDVDRTYSCVTMEALWSLKRSNLLDGIGLHDGDAMKFVGPSLTRKPWMCCVCVHQ